MNINVVTIGGNLTRDPEVKTSASGLDICSFSLANNRRIKGEDHTTFVDCVAFGKTATIIGQYFTKGKSIAVTGRLQQDSWEDTHGHRRTKIKVVVNDFSFVDRAVDRGPVAHTPPPANPASGWGTADHGPKVPDDQIPF